MIAVPIYVLLPTLMEYGARLATNGFTLCRKANLLPEITVIFELEGARGQGARLRSPSPVDEFVCETEGGEMYMAASNKFIAKIAGKPTGTT